LTSFVISSLVFAVIVYCKLLEITTIFAYLLKNLDATGFVARLQGEYATYMYQNPFISCYEALGAPIFLYRDLWDKKEQSL